MSKKLQPKTNITSEEALNFLREKRRELDMQVENCVKMSKKIAPLKYQAKVIGDVISLLSGVMVEEKDANHLYHKIKNAMLVQGYEMLDCLDNVVKILSQDEDGMHVELVVDRMQEMSLEYRKGDIVEAVNEYLGFLDCDSDDESLSYSVIKKKRSSRGMKLCIVWANVNKVLEIEGKYNEH